LNWVPAGDRRIWCQENRHAIFLKNLEHFMKEEVSD